MAKRSYVAKSSRSKRASKRRSLRKGSKKMSKRRSSRKGSKKCPNGQVRTYKKLASGKLAKGKCMRKPFGPKKAVAEEARAEDDYSGDLEFNLPALGFRIKKGRKASKKSYRKKASKKSRKGSKKSRKSSKRKASKKVSKRKSSKKASKRKASKK